MKISKKIISILGIIIVSNLPIGSFTSTIDADNTTSKIENNKSINEIEDILSLKEYDSMKKIELDSSGKPASSKDISNQNTKSGLESLEDGLYVIDYKDGWIRGNDQGLIRTVVVPSGMQGGLQKIEYSEFVSTITKSQTSTFGPSFVKLSIQQAYGNGIGNAQSINVRQWITAPKGKDLFLKAQTVYRKYFTINIKNNKIIDSAASYQPSSYTLSSLEFDSGSKVNQKKLYEPTDRNILGDPSYDIKQVIEGTLDHTETQHIPSTLPHRTRTNYYPQDKTVGLYFTVSSSGKYEMRDKMMPLSAASTQYGIGTSMTLYKVNKSDNSIMSKVASIPYNFKEYNYIVDFIGNPLVADLDSNSKYLLVMNIGKNKPWSSHNNRDITYMLQFKKI